MEIQSAIRERRAHVSQKVRTTIKIRFPFVGHKELLWDDEAQVERERYVAVDLTVLDGKYGVHRTIKSFTN